MRPETIKILEESTGNHFSETGYSNIFLELSPKAKEIINKAKNYPTKWNKIFANDIMNKGLLSKIHKELTQLNTRKTK